MYSLGCRTNACIYMFRGRIQRKTWCMDPGTELIITSPCVHSRVDSNTFTMGNPVPESTLTLCQCRLYPPVRDFGFGLRGYGRIETAVPILYVLCDQVKHSLVKGSWVKNVFSFIATFQCGILKPGLPNLFPHCRQIIRLCSWI
jgi:hypothetical protein